MNQLQYLLDLRAAVVNGKFDSKQLASLGIDDTDGRTVPLNDPDILAVLERRIAAEQAAQ